jgi:hypothetical protein
MRAPSIAMFHNPLNKTLMIRHYNHKHNRSNLVAVRWLACMPICIPSCILAQALHASLHAVCIHMRFVTTAYSAYQPSADMNLVLFILVVSTYNYR